MLMQTVFEYNPTTFVQQRTAVQNTRVRLYVVKRKRYLGKWASTSTRSQGLDLGQFEYEIRSHNLETLDPRPSTVVLVKYIILCVMGVNKFGLLL